MHIVLTDVLACPRCGPDFGLIVLADELHDRRVISGRLGCANCREEFPIRAGVADLRAGQGPEVTRTPAGTSLEERALRVAALLGVGEGQGVVLVVGGEPELVAEVARLLPNAQLLGAAVAEPDVVGGSSPDWILHGNALPLRSRSARGVALLAASASLLDEAARVLAPGARLVVDPASDDTAAGLASRGLEMLLQQDGVAVASRPGPR